MVFNPARPELATVTSETLQAKIRELLPSQDGFGADLAAQNVIVPIIDLTASAEGTSTPEYLQTALNYGGNTPYTAFGSTVALATTPGFYRVVGGLFAFAGGADQTSSIAITDGSTSKNMWAFRNIGASSVQTSNGVVFDIVCFVNAGETLNAIAAASAQMAGSVRQVADSNGNLVLPSGFSPQ
jgi:hypothetical protein